MKDAYKMTHTWEGSIKAYQAKNRATSKIIRGADNARIKRSRTVLKMYKKGVKNSAIAEMTGYCERRVRGIIAEYRSVIVMVQQLNCARKLQELKAEKVGEPTVKTVRQKVKDKAKKPVGGAKNV